MFWVSQQPFDVFFFAVASERERERGGFGQEPRHGGCSGQDPRGIYLYVLLSMYGIFTYN